MQLAVYNEVVDEVLDELRESIAFAGAPASRGRHAGGSRSRLRQGARAQLRVLGRLGEFSDLGRPLVVGPSRKGFLTRPLPRRYPRPSATGRPPPRSLPR